MKKTIYPLFVLALCLALSACGSPQGSSSAHKHNYTQEITVQADCTKAGVKTITCSECGESYTVPVEKVAHTYSSKVTTHATCSANGVRTFTCSECGESYTESIAKTAHSYSSGNITKQPTCTSTGIRTYTCYGCGDKKTESIPALGHESNNMICTRCGEECPIELNMTSSEKQKANAVEYISQRQIWHQDDNDRYVLVFSLLDASKKELAVPAVVKIHITNDKGEVVYTATKIVKTSDFGTWYYNNGAVEKLQATIYIYDNEIAAGAVSDGDIYFTVDNTGYFSFSESKLSISDLPKKAAGINLPDVPCYIDDRTYSGTLEHSVKITNITYEVSGDDLYIYFAGEKVYDSDGNNYSRSCTIGWKLYDSEGYVVASGTCYTEALSVGEKFRNEKAYAWDCIVPGENYKLVILDVR